MRCPPSVASLQPEKSPPPLIFACPLALAPPPNSQVVRGPVARQPDPHLVDRRLPAEPSVFCSLPFSPFLLPADPPLSRTDLPTGKKRFAGHTTAGYACGLGFSPDGKYLSSGDADGSVVFWDWKTGKLLKRLRAHREVVIQHVWLPHESSKLITASFDGTCKLWVRPALPPPPSRTLAWRAR